MSVLKNQTLQSLLVSVSFAAAFFYAPNAYCWGMLGHQIVGAIAEERMEPATRAYVSGLLGVEPTAVAATWADAVREDERFGHDEHEYDQTKRDADRRNFSDYHFVEIPSGWTYDTRPTRDLKDAFGAISGAISLLKDATGHVTKPQKIIALRYLVHLLGDIHQPLHVGNEHDLGANFCYGLWLSQTSPQNLHAIWDGNLVTALGLTLVDPGQVNSRPPRDYPDYVAALKKLKPNEIGAAKPKDVSLPAIKAWIDETTAIRDNVVISGDAYTSIREIGVYPEKPGALAAYPKLEYEHRAYCMWFSDQRKSVYGNTSPKRAKDIPASAFPHLDELYVKVNTAVVEQQLVNAGIRLAAVLDDVAQSVAQSEAQRRHSGHPVSAAEESVILDSVQRAFQNKAQIP